MKQPLKCLYCLAMFPNAPGADLFCTPAHRIAYEEQQAQVQTALLAAGFTQEQNSPTAYTKDGVTLTLQEVNHVGMDQAMAAHSESAKVVAAGIAASAASGNAAGVTVSLKAQG